MANTLWISHRGLHQEAVENSQRAFRFAVEAGFTAVETDLRCTIDGHIVLHHDPHMLRTANHPAVIERMTLAEFQKVQLTDGQYGFTFADLMEEFSALSWIFDIKPESGAETIKALHRWSEQHKLSEWLSQKARFLLWRQHHSKLLKHYFPQAITLAGSGECRRAGIAVLLGLAFAGDIRPGRTYALPARFFGKELFTKDFVHAYHRRGSRVLAYLPEHDDDARKALAAGVDEVLTNGRPVGLSTGA